jgi:hypothetical protein
MEQMIGRHHRRGSTADVVICNIVLGIKEQLDKIRLAISDANVAQLRTQRPQRLAICDKEILHKEDELP